MWDWHFVIYWIKSKIIWCLKIRKFNDPKKTGTFSISRYVYFSILPSGLENFCMWNLTLYVMRLTPWFLNAGHFWHFCRVSQLSYYTSTILIFNKFTYGSFAIKIESRDIVNFQVDKESFLNLMLYKNTLRINQILHFEDHQ